MAYSSKIQSIIIKGTFQEFLQDVGHGSTETTNTDYCEICKENFELVDHYKYKITCKDCQSWTTIWCDSKRHYLTNSGPSTATDIYQSNGGWKGHQHICHACEGTGYSLCTKHGLRGAHSQCLHENRGQHEVA